MTATAGSPLSVVCMGVWVKAFFSAQPRESLTANEGEPHDASIASPMTASIASPMTANEVSPLTVSEREPIDGEHPRAQ